MNSNILDRLDATHAFLWRWRWPVRLLVAMVLCACFGRWAYTRMTTPPGDPAVLAQVMYYGSPAAQLSPDDAAKRLFDAIARMPAPPSIAAPTTAPAGQQWDFKDQTRGSSASQTLAYGTWPVDPTDAACGPWTPAERHHLQQIIAYFEDPKVEAAVEDIRRIARGPVRLPELAFTSGYLSQIRQTCKVLRAHARYELAHKHDLDAACGDLETVLLLADCTEDGGPLINYLLGVAIRYLVLDEIIFWSREFELTRPQAEQLQVLLGQANAELPQRWRRMIQGEGRLKDRMLDGMYSKDTSGDGWVVLYTPRSSSLAGRVPSVLNLLSPLVNDRRTVTAKFALADEVVSQVGDLPFRRAEQVLRSLPEATRGWMSGNPADGPTQILFGVGSMNRAYEQGVQGFACKRAAQACVAVSGFRAEHGHYPATLADLVPEYLPAVPKDPIDDQPLRYRLDNPDDYTLYSLGEDGEDDGGSLQKATSMRGIRERDWVFTGPRDEPTLEWFLVPAQPAAPSSQGTPAGDPAIGN